MSDTFATPQPESTPPPVLPDRLPSEAAEQYDGAWREEHATPETAARELIRSRKQQPVQREQIEHALDELPEITEITEVSYVDGRPKDQTVTLHEAARDRAAYSSAQKAETQQRLQSLLTELTGQEQPQPVTGICCRSRSRPARQSGEPLTRTRANVALTYPFPRHCGKRRSIRRC
jgi:hypothetical protein